MATEQKTLARGSIAGPDTVTIFSSTATSNIQPFLVVTNNSAVIVEVNIRVSDGTTTLELETRKIAAGIGKAWRVLSLSDLRISQNYSIEIEIDTGGVDYHLSGIEFT